MSGPARHLVSLRRSVAAHQREHYDRLWSELHGAATALRAHAWRFHSAADPRLCLEFLEFAADADPRADPALSTALARLADEIGAAEAEEWREGAAEPAR